MAEDSDGDRCGLLVEAAMETATEKCGSREAVFRQVQQFFGKPLQQRPEEVPDRGEATPVQPEDCDAILEDGIGEDDIQTSRTKRTYAMCRAWDLLDDEEVDLSFSAAIEEAWDEIDEAEEKEIETAKEMSGQA